jgi:hypothetical protein
MNDSIRHRDGPHQNSTAGQGNPRRVTTWARALAAAVLLDPAALRRTRPTTAGRRLALPDAGRTSVSNAAADPNVPMTPVSAPTAPALAALAVVDVAAAALIECGYDESAFLLLALADPTPRTPNLRTPAARTPSVPRRRTSRLLRRTGGGSAGDSTGRRPWGAGT